MSSQALIKRRLHDIYRVLCEGEAADVLQRKVSRLLEQYAGREAQLLVAVQHKYGAPAWPAVL